MKKLEYVILCSEKMITTVFNSNKNNLPCRVSLQGTLLVVIGEQELRIAGVDFWWLGG